MASVEDEAPYGGGDGGDLENGQEEMDVGRQENIKVVVRVRPLLAFEEERGASDTVVSLHPDDGKSLTVSGHEARHKLRVRFDAAFGGGSSQEEVYAQIKECSAAVVEGFNTTVFAYGQTGTGKSHTMFGPPGHVQQLIATGNGAGISALSGVIPRAVVDMFGHIRAITQASPGASGGAPGATASVPGMRVSRRALVCAA